MALRMQLVREHSRARIMDRSGGVIFIGSCQELLPGMRIAKDAGCTLKLLHHLDCAAGMRQLAEWTCSWTSFLHYCSCEASEVQRILQQGAHCWLLQRLSLHDEAA